MECPYCGNLDLLKIAIDFDSDFSIDPMNAANTKIHFHAKEVPVHKCLTCNITLFDKKSDEVVCLAQEQAAKDLGINFKATRFVTSPGFATLD